MTRNYALDGLRGYAALVVVIYHAILDFDATLVERVLYKPIQNINGMYDILTKIFLSLFNGETAVVIFFVISGAVLFDSLKKDNDIGIIVTSIDFLIKRIIRLYPTLIVCLSVFFVIEYSASKIKPNIFTAFSISQLIQNSILHKITMHGSSWTLQIEIYVIPLIIIGYYAYKYLGNIGTILFLGFSILVIDSPQFLFNIPVLNICLMYFGFGFIIPTEIGKNIFTSFNKNSWYFILPSLIFVRQIVPHSSFAGSFVQTLFAFMLVGIIYYRQAGTLGFFLEKRISVYLGKISYSFYLFNVVFLYIICKMLKVIPLTSKHYLEYGLLSSILTIIITVPVSHISEKYLEQPSIKLGRKISNFIHYINNTYIRKNGVVNNNYFSNKQ